MKKPLVLNDPEQMADFLIEKLGKEIVFAFQLALGKPNNIVNAIYRRAKKDPSINLTLITALSLETPSGSSELEKRMLGPMVERVWKGYVELEYARDVRLHQVPSNIKVIEFFMRAGMNLNSEMMQQTYSATNYTHVIRDLTLSGVNVLGNLICQKELDGELKYSLSCNSDLDLEIVDFADRLAQLGKPIPLLVGEVNDNLPFMYGDAVVDTDFFDAVLVSPQSNFTLFGAPKEPINTIDYCIGLYSSVIIPDDGTLQIGIGSLGDAIAYNLIARHKHNDQYVKLLKDMGITENYKELIQDYGGTDAFKKGLYTSTEMLVDSFVDLYKNGVMERRVYDDIRIQRLVSENYFPEDRHVTGEGFRKLVEDGDVGSVLTEKDVNFLKYFGVFKEEVQLQGDKLVCGDIAAGADMKNDANLQLVLDSMLGSDLKNGYWAHGGFFLGPPSFYKGLNDMSEEERKGINMTGVSYINQLYAVSERFGSMQLRMLQRKNARFINAGLMATALGAVVSDGLEDGRVISGIGGQYNFVSMAHALQDARSGIMIRSTRGEGKNLRSNILYSYGHCSIPRHLRDLVITEYGIADIRSKQDSEIVKEMIKVTDSRFQEDLAVQAKKNKKLPQSYMIPDAYRNNTPAKLEAFLAPYRKQGLFTPFPFGTSFTQEEIVLGKALRGFKAKSEDSKLGVIKGILGQFMGSPPASAKPYLERMQLDNPKDFKEKLLQKIVLCALKDSGAI